MCIWLNLLCGCVLFAGMVCVAFDIRIFRVGVVCAEMDV